MRAPSRRRDILFIFYRRFGTVAALAGQIVAGIQLVDGVNVSLPCVEDRAIGELLPGKHQHDLRLRRARTIGRFATADAIVIGSPAYFGSIASPVKRLIEDSVSAEAAPTIDRSRPWRHHLFRNQVGAAFTSSATPQGGNEMTLHSILKLMMHMGMLIVTKWVIHGRLTWDRERDAVERGYRPCGDLDQLSPSSAPNNSDAGAEVTG
jgi:multimeric flavodoxin WrbA